MRTKLKTSTITTEHKEKRRRQVSINTEYLSVFRTQSYVEFFTKAQFLVTEPSCSSPKAANLLLVPEQDSIPFLLNVLGSISDLKILMLNYFNTSAEASRICTELLRSISAGHDTYRFIHTSLDAFSNSSDGELSSVISKLSSFTQFRNPFSSPTQKDFKLIHEDYISILHHLKSKRKQVTRRRKLVEYCKKAAGVCLTAGCAVLGVASIGKALQSLTRLLVGPAIIKLFPGHLRNKWQKMRSRLLRKEEDEIDAAAKGTYIMSRDFDTMSRFVDRLHEEVERIKGIIRFWVGREDTFSLQELVKELRRSGSWLKKLVEELEEQAWLCLVTINKVRISVMEQILVTKRSL